MQIPFTPRRSVQLDGKLIDTPRQGNDLGGGLYKIRLGSASKGGGKSGGFRVITYYVAPTAEGEVVYLVTIYDKSEDETMTKAELQKLLGPALD